MPNGLISVKSSETVIYKNPNALPLFLFIFYFTNILCSLQTGLGIRSISLRSFVLVDL